MKTFLSILAVLILFSGCSVTRKVNKTENKSSNESSVSADTKTSLEDKSVTTVTESIDTAIILPGTKIVSENTGQNTSVVINGDTLSARYDPVKNIIHAQFTGKPKSVNVQGNRKTEIQNNIKKEETASVDSTRKTATENVTIKKDIKRSYIVFGIVGLVVLIIVVFVAWKYGKKIIALIR